MNWYAVNGKAWYEYVTVAKKAWTPHPPSCTLQQLSLPLHKASISLALGRSKFALAAFTGICIWHSLSTGWSSLPKPSSVRAKHPVGSTRSMPSSMASWWTAVPSFSTVPAPSRLGRLNVKEYLLPLCTSTQCSTADQKQQSRWEICTRDALL